MRVKTDEPLRRLGKLISTRASLPSVIMLPVRAHADALLQPPYLDGVTREVTEALQSVPDILVIDPATALQFRSQNIAPRQLFAELNVQYALSSHVVRVDQHLTFTQQLIDARTGEVIWHQPFDARLDHLYDFKKQVATRVVSHMLPHLRQAEIKHTYRKSTSKLTAYDLTMRALAALERLTPETLDEADDLLARARLADPEYATAFAWSARAQSLRVGQAWTSDRKATAENAMLLAKEAARLDDRNSLALATAGHLHSFLLRDYASGLQCFDRSLAASSNDALAWCLSSLTLTYTGRPKEALQRAEHAIWLSPFDTNIFTFAFAAGLACYALSDYVAAIKWLRMAHVENPVYTAIHKPLIAALVGDGRVDEAREVRRELQALEPSFGAGGIVTSPFNDATMHNLYQTQMRTAGV